VSREREASIRDEDRRMSLFDPEDSLEGLEEEEHDEDGFVPDDVEPEYPGGGPEHDWIRLNDTDDDG
jgi:hypothetical protein